MEQSLWWLVEKLRQPEAMWKCFREVTCEGVNCLVTLKVNLSAINPLCFHVQALDPCLQHSAH